MKKFPEILPQSVQYDLFAHFITNDKTEVSNSIEYWEFIPKYFFTPQQIKNLRTKSGHADPFEWHYMDGNTPCKVEIQPALIKQKGGKYLAFFPSTTEELVEEALKKILTDQQYGLHNQKDMTKPETWVRFSLSMIEKELKNKGRGRNRSRIKQAIEIMSKCNITLFRNEQEIWTGPILSELITVGRKEYIEDTTAHHLARLPIFISYAINSLDYRQFNYARLLGCNEQLTRWIYKKLIHRYKQASMLNDYHFTYSSLENSGLLQQGRDNDNRRKVLQALDELVKIEVIASYTVDIKKQGRKIVDITYIIKPTVSFMREQKAANKRATDNKTNLAIACAKQVK